MSKSISSDEALATVEDVDAVVADSVAPYRKTPAVRIVSFLGKAGDQPPLRLLCFATFSAGVIGRRPRVTRAAVRMLAAHTLATWIKSFVKHRINRTRPNERENSVDNHITAGRSTAKRETSFPSGHSAGAIAVACAYAREFPDRGPAAVTAAVAVSLAQILRGSHYPSDVAAGLAIGTVSEAAVSRLLGPALGALAVQVPDR